jgi:PadR family transcriptional regulator, regulatory protein AphA
VKSPSKPLTTTSHALLGLLALRPWTTYELAKQLQRSLGWFWGRAERKLYDEPKKLVAEGLATATVQHTGTRPRTVYAITSDGRTALRAWLGGPSTPPILEFEAMVRVFFADGGTLEQLRSTLAGVQADAAGRLVALRTMIDTVVDAEHDEFAGRRSLNALGLRFHLDHEQLQIDWARWALQETATWNSPTDAAGWDWRQVINSSVPNESNKPAHHSTD